MRFSIIGIGRLGGALALALADAGGEIEALVSRDPRSAAAIAGRLRPRPAVHSLESEFALGCDVVLITTADQSIRRAADALSGKLGKGAVVLHTSGSLPSTELEELKASGCVIGSLHPLVSVSSADTGRRAFGGVYFCVEGDAGAVRAGRRIAKMLGGRAFTVSTAKKPLYHLAAVASAGHLVALADVAFTLMTAAGLARSEARKILLPLMRSTLANLSVQETANALTGTFARGDAAALERQIASLGEDASALEAEIFYDLAMRSLDIAAASRRGDLSDIASMRERLLIAKEKLR
ncbi:MAG: Rossmann-like and DUF2520 domain-containing protein [Pyrinomonadaceae bacterium]